MRRVVPIAAFLLIVGLVPASAQRGGVRGSVHGGFVGRGPIGHPVSVFSGAHVGVAPRGFHHEGFGGFRGGFRGGFHRHCFGCRRFGYGAYGYGYGGYYDPFLWDSFYSDDYRFDQEQAREEALAQEMDRLNLEEQRLRDEEEMWQSRREHDSYAGRDQGANARSAQSHEPASSQPAPSTVLVFRDQHQQEVQNYAIADGTLWVLTPQSAKKIPISQLDLDATRKVNDDRGVEFKMPSER